MIERFKEHISFGMLLNLILPGAGHLYWREYLFGTFVFLVMIIASVLFFFSFLVDLPFAMKNALFGLPIIFYGFTFADLWRAVSRQKRQRTHSRRGAWAFLVTVLTVCFVLPLSPVNFVIRNRPHIMTVDAGQLGSDAGEAVFCLVDRCAYHVNLFFLDDPYPRRSPARWELVQYRVQSELSQIGLVLGYPGEEVTFFNDSLFVDGFPVEGPETLSLSFGGRVPLTQVDPDAILIATLKQGAIENAVQISPRDVIGKVHRLF